MKRKSYPGKYSGARARGIRMRSRMMAERRGRKARGFTRTAGYYGRFPPGGDELKFFDTAITGTIDATGEIAPAAGSEVGLCLIPQGVTEKTRIGRKCTIESIQMRGYIKLAGSAGAATYSVALVHDTQTNGAYPSFANIYEGTDVNAPMKLENSSRFRILKRWVGSMNQSAGNAGSYANVHRSIKFYKKCNIPLEFSAATGAIAELRTNNLFLVWVSSGDDTITFTSTWRLRFSDN